MDADRTLTEWLAHLAAQGVAHEPGCPFMAWASTVDASQPVRALLDEAPAERALEAALRVLDTPNRGDAAYWVDLIDRRSNSEAVKRWARARA